ncbi:putative phage tail protein [Collimonas antrihumi]|uniref:putative phage tail protein n=1 Tax=Collimonas antrihumi TaxID=1940615 RepID=UPI001B8CBA84|nr:putative phage tail protein [Collimonas antrihumi]
MNKFVQALSHLLPTGWAFPRHPKSVVMRWLKAFAGVLEEHHDFTSQTIRQWMPHRTCSRIEEWEDALGLPDPCFGENQDIEQRRTTMLARFRGGVTLAYDDSSADSIGAIQRYLRLHGYEIEAWYNTPFRVGRNRVGEKLGTLNGVLHIRVLHICSPFRTGANRAGQRLVNCSKNSEAVECLLKRIVPARFAIHVIYF